MVLVQLVKELRERTGAGFLDCKKALVAAESNIEHAIAWLQKKGKAKAIKKAGRITAEGLTSIIAKNNKAVICEVNCETDFVAKNEQFISLVQKIAELLLNNQPQNLKAALALNLSGKSLDETLISATATIGEKISLRRFELITKKDTQIFGPYIHQGGTISVLTVLDETDDIAAARGIAMHVAAINPQYLFENEIKQNELKNKLATFIASAIASGKSNVIAEKIAQGKLNKDLTEICLLKQTYVKGDGESVEQYLKKIKATLINAVRYKVGEGIAKKADNFVKEVSTQVAANKQI